MPCHQCHLLVAFLKAQMSAMVYQQEVECHTTVYLYMDWSKDVDSVGWTMVSPKHSHVGLHNGHCHCLYGRPYCHNGGTGLHLWLPHKEMLHSDWLLNLLPAAAPLKGFHLSRGVHHSLASISRAMRLCLCRYLTILALPVISQKYSFGSVDWSAMYRDMCCSTCWC